MRKWVRNGLRCSNTTQTTRGWQSAPTTTTSTSSTLRATTTLCMGNCVPINPSSPILIGPVMASTSKVTVVPTSSCSSMWMAAVSLKVELVSWITSNGQPTLWSWAGMCRAFSQRLKVVITWMEWIETMGRISLRLGAIGDSWTCTGTQPWKEPNAYHIGHIQAMWWGWCSTRMTPTSTRWEGTTRPSWCGNTNDPHHYLKYQIYSSLIKLAHVEPLLGSAEGYLILTVRCIHRETPMLQIKQTDSCAVLPLPWKYPYLVNSTCACNNTLWVGWTV